MSTPFPLGAQCLLDGTTPVQVLELDGRVLVAVRGTLTRRWVEPARLVGWSDERARPEWRRK